MKNEATIQNLTDFDNKTLLIVDDDNPFRKDCPEQWKRRVLRFYKLKV